MRYTILFSNITRLTQILGACQTVEVNTLNIVFRVTPVTCNPRGLTVIRNFCRGNPLIELFVHYGRIHYGLVTVTGISLVARFFYLKKNMLYSFLKGPSKIGNHSKILLDAAGPHYGPRDS